MPRRSTLLCAFALLVLIAGWSTTPAQAHCDGKHTGDHPHCQPGGPGGNDVEYEVIMNDGELWSDPNRTFEGIEGGGQSNPVLVYFQALDMDLSYFFYRFGVIDEGGQQVHRGTRCFAGTPLPEFNRSMTISRDGDVAVLRYAFRAFGDDGTTLVGYSLYMEGSFDPVDNWPPEGGPTTVDIDWWSMDTESRKSRRISCRGLSGEFEGAGQSIQVTRAN